ncbi:hypothetical protein [Salinimonas chungwhensis]|uniref:hypothetical protein n=1 Tax=Salinimonas chungwhensis TaxID=265425 RepID=UPI00036231E9|nr:hypothetical protein [Salinimonas chungwhensis]
MMDGAFTAAMAHLSKKSEEPSNFFLALYPEKKTNGSNKTLLKKKLWFIPELLEYKKSITDPVNLRIYKE